MNVSIRNSSFPDCLKVAKVTPLFKKNSRVEPGNYRPVSVLCIISKLLEKVVYDQVMDYLVKSNLLYMYQSGFRSAYSTDSCLIHHVKSKLSKGQYTGMVMLDLQKAFDTDTVIKFSATNCLRLVLV